MQGASSYFADTIAKRGRSRKKKDDELPSDYNERRKVNAANTAYNRL